MISAIAKQAVALNVAVFVCCLALTIILIPISIAGWMALGLIAIILPIGGAIKASDGVYYSYPAVGSRI